MSVSVDGARFELVVNDGTDHAIPLPADGYFGDADNVFEDIKNGTDLKYTVATSEAWTGDIVFECLNHSESDGVLYVEFMVYKVAKQ